MINLIERLNAIKTSCSMEWLTPSQSQSWAKMQQYFLLNEVVNLYGPPGSGKTFIAWLRVKQGAAIYIPDLETLMAGTEHCSSLPVIDNLPPTRNAYRTLLKHLSFQKQKQAIAITQAALPDDCYRVSLECTKQDREFVCQRLRTIDHTVCFRDEGNLHHLVNPDLPVVFSGEYHD